MYSLLTRKDIALNKIRSLIEQASVGDRLPSEDQLAVDCDVSRPTIRTALITLEAEGHVVRRHGLGTYVTEPPTNPHPPIEALWSVFEVVRHSGFSPAVRDLVITERVIHQKASHALTLASDSALTKVSRLITADQRPGIYLEDFLAPTMTPYRFDSFDGESLSKYLLDHYAISLGYALTNISVMAASEELSRVLGVSKKSPILFIEQTAYTEDDRPVVYSLGFYREGLVTYAVKRRTASPSQERIEP